MLQKYDGCIGRRYTSAGEVPQQTRYTGSRYTSAGEALEQASGHVPHTYTCAQVYTRIDKLEQLQAASCIYACEDELGSYAKEEEKDMFYVVDEQDIYINEFTTREEAERFCEKWNTSLRFNEWGEQKAHIIEG